MNLKALCHDLEALAREAGAAIMDVYAADFDAEIKGDGSPVTAADTAAEAIILPGLQRLAPDIAVISEENAASHAMAAPERFFLVDPLDGTKEFLKKDGKGSFTVNIALIDQGAPLLGVVFAPALQQLYAGVVGEGAHLHVGEARRSIRVRAVPADGATAVASLSHRDAETDAWLAANGIEDAISVGSSLKFCLVAAGEADAYPRFGPTMEWDTGAGDAVLRAAGGAVLDVNGATFRYGKPDYRNGPFIALGQFKPQRA